MNRAIEELRLPLRREERLVHATLALLLAQLVDDESDLETRMRSAVRIMYGDADLIAGDAD
ncbi:MAG: hypothetical protein ABSG37_13280 [Candidatus Limnocylindrales bacterium]|jgi:hypothetical protein